MQMTYGSGPVVRVISELQRGVRWWFDVRTSDPVRRVRLRGLLMVLPPMVLGGIWIDWYLQSLTSAVILVIGALCAIPTRRGSSLGALAMMLILAVGIGLGFDPASYIGPPIVIHVLFLFPVALAALSLPPATTLLAATVTVVTLSIRAWTGGEPVAEVRNFTTIGLLNLFELALPLMAMSALFGRALRGKEQALQGQAIAYAELQRSNAELEQRVADATATLRRTQALQQTEWEAVAHDINNSLASAYAVVDDALLDMGKLGIPPEKCGAIERRVMTAFRVIGNLVNDMNTISLLDHDRLDLNVVPTDAAEIVRRVVEQIDAQAQQDGCRLSLQLNRPLPLIAADGWRVERALANLIGNGLKYTQPVRNRERRVDVVVSARAGGVAVVITDTGRGMDAAALELVGRPFTRLASARGTMGMGIGVYLSRGIIEHHGGTLTYASDGPDRGTTVTVWLPECVSDEGAP